VLVTFGAVVAVEGVRPAGVADESVLSGSCVVLAGCIVVSSASGGFPPQDVNDTTAIKQKGKKNFLMFKIFIGTPIHLP
jgi:hypothetical protein